MIKVGIIGFGLSGQVFHGRVIKACVEFDVRAVVTRDSEKAKAVAKEHPHAEVYERVEDMLLNDGIDLVVISTPNTSHVNLALQALEAGKHVVIEKPFTVTTEEAMTIMACEKKTGKRVSVYHNRRWDSDFLTVKKLINDQSLGRLVEFESHFDRFRPMIKTNAWREEAKPGSGILYDLGSHLIDQALNLFGLPQRVYCDLSHQRQGATDDQFDVILYYKELKVTLKSGSLVAAPTPRFLLLGTEGAYQTFGLDQQEPLLREDASVFWGPEPKAQWGSIYTGQDQRVYPSLAGDYRDFYKKLGQAITQGGPLPVTSQEAYHVVMVIEKALQSSREGQCVWI